MNKNRRKRVRRNIQNLFKDLPSYSAMNLMTGEVRACESQDKACAIAFGRNKDLGRQDWLACIRTTNGLSMV